MSRSAPHAGPVREKIVPATALAILSLLFAFGIFTAVDRGPLPPPLRIKDAHKQSTIDGGKLLLAENSELFLEIPGNRPDRDLLLTADIVFYGTNKLTVRAWSGETAAETALWHDLTVKESVLRLEVKIEHGRLAASFPERHRVEEAALPPGSYGKISLALPAARASLDNLKLTDSSSGKTLFETSFGMKRSKGRIALLALVIFLFLTAVRWIDGKILVRLRLANYGDPQATFFAAYFPAAVSLFFIDHLAFFPSLLLILAGTLVWRIVLIGLPRHRVVLVPWAVLIPLSLILVFFLVVVPGKPGEENAGLGLMMISSIAAALAVGEIFWWRVKGEFSWMKALAAGSAPFLFICLAPIARQAAPDGTSLGVLCGLGLLMAILSKFSLAGSAGKSIRGSGIFLVLWACMIFPAAEMAVRQASYSRSWRPDRLDEEHVPSDALFWAPKSLFGSQASPTVSPVNFRSGPVSNEIPPGIFRIVIMGGSNVWGDRLENVSDTWGEKLETALNARKDGRTYEVVNAGVKGYTLFQLMVLHTLYLKDLKYDLLILYCNFNDHLFNTDGPFTYRELWEAKTGGRWDRIENFLSDQGIQENRSWVIKTQDLLRHSRLYNGLTRAILDVRGGRMVRHPKKFGLKSVNPVEDYVKNLEQVANSASERGAKILFTTEFICCEKPRHGEEAAKSYGVYNDAMEQTATRLAIPFCDTAQGMYETRPDLKELVFPWDTVHLNPEGTTELARVMAQCLDQHGLLK